MNTKLVVPFLAFVLVGCASPTGRAHRETDDTTITVTVRPLGQLRYEMIAVIERRYESLHLQYGSSAGDDKVTLPTLVATLDGKPAEFATSNVLSEVGPRGRLQVTREGDKIVAEYRVGYADGERSCFATGRVEVLPR